jgi:hydroxymethylbilane synthase
LPPRVLGTRGSALALRQAEIARAALRAVAPESEWAVHTLETTGDRLANQPLRAIGGQGVFVKEIERALLEEEIDLAIHSLKDLPPRETPGLTLAAFLPREDPRDALVSAGGAGLAGLAPGARVGTSSARRAALLRAARPDLVAVEIRGNVDTRLAKLRAGRYEAVFLAAAGLRRLGRQAEISAYLPLDTFPPAAGQGILALQVRAPDLPLRELVARLDDPPTRLAAEAERACLAAVGAGCRAAFAAHARREGDQVRLVAILEVDGVLRRFEGGAPPAQARALGEQAGAFLVRPSAAALATGGAG